jgi:hypothetical protein
MSRRMSAATAEPLSPELVLVCPELRANAIGDLGQPVPRWAVLGTSVDPASHEIADDPWHVGASIFVITRFGAAAMISATAITLSLTLIADALR